MQVAQQWKRNNVDSNAIGAPLAMASQCPRPLGSAPSVASAKRAPHGPVGGCARASLWRGHPERKRQQVANEQHANDNSTENEKCTALPAPCSL